ncbi:hypothetical protein LTR37_014156 [Vermiconidia calcicola]|uniref:Uncharacterized protein n=1 Tax=Vermiconidia calcicola TaxID=1690605 RepID=A0ACC3MW21_9PEZI|nr:hypothetical protein LTR37_014156 [Vermiconidia calcicola]
MPLLGTSAPVAVQNLPITGKSEANHETRHTNGVDRPLPYQSQHDDGLAVLSLRNLLFDICNQNGGGHGGSAVGHAAMFLYALNHLVGFDAWTMDELKAYGSAKLNGFTTLSHAHPEIEVPGIEVTTGPLGQGVANSVGLAIASKNLAARFNRPGYDIVQSRIYCITGDGCLMEGVALESIALAGHLQLDNLVLIYDNNQVTCDGPLDWINTEDVNGKMRACGWAAMEVLEGSHDVNAIVEALQSAQTVRGRPTFINVRTVIGVGTSNAGTSKAHHGTFAEEDVARSKVAAGLDPSVTHSIPDKALSYFRERKSHGQKLNLEWDALLSNYTAAYPKLSAQLLQRRYGGPGKAVFSLLDSIDTTAMGKLSTRESNGEIMEKVWPVCEALCGGGADLVNSNKIYYSEADAFLPSYPAGRYVRYGIREHAMASISNGIAAYGKGTFIPITATFLMFYLYAAPGVRMGALSHLQALHFATHDSFAEGQNGPTHQPVEVDSLYRAMPNLIYFRPCDAEEVVAAWKLGLSSTSRPTMISLGRDPVGPVPGTDRNLALKGAYVLRENSDAAVTLASCGTSLHRVVAAANELEKAGLHVRVVSCPSLDLLEEQKGTYKASIFPADGKPIVSVEEYVATTWARYVTASISMTTYGYSASSASNYARFGMDAESIVRKVRGYLAELGGTNARLAGWKQL